MEEVTGLTLATTPYHVRSTAHHALHLQFDISDNARKLRTVQSGG
jgi:hypothetical protein